MILVQGLATVTVLLSIASFTLYLVAMVRQSTGQRPKIIPVDRFGRPLPAAENPDYRDTEEDHAD